jgi:hypothetical protein
MRGVVLALVLVVAACSNSFSPTAQSSPSAPITPSPAALKGDLPIWIELGSGDNTALAFPFSAGGFVHFPGGAFRRDARADMLIDRTIPTLVRMKTPDQPYLYAGEGSPNYTYQITYDRVVGRWLPVNQAQVSADGLHYAYIDYENGAATPQRMHVVDVRSGSDQVVYRDSNKPRYGAIGFAPPNIYLTDCGESNCWGSLWRLDAISGTIVKVSDRRGWWRISGRAAWIVCWSDSCGTGISPGPNQLLRVDLITGYEETWDRGSGIHLIGTDGDGMPIVAVNFVSPTWQAGTGPPGRDAGESVVFRVSAPEQTDRLYSVPISQPWAGFDRATADRFGIWLQASYVPPGDFTVVLDFYSKASGGREISHDFLGVVAGSFG